MFDSLSKALGSVFDGLRGKARLTDADVSAALSQIRTALLEADVALPVVKTLTENIRTRAVGMDLIKSVEPAQQVVKIVHDELVAALGGAADTAQIDINLNAKAPVVLLMVGLQGSGKTTTTAKLAKYLTDKRGQRVMMASLDTHRPAAQDQLATLGTQTGLSTLPIVAGETPLQITSRALKDAAIQNFDVLILDTAGRMTMDETLMAEVVAIRDLSHPTETLLVADAMTGQDAVNIAGAFNEQVGLTGLILTRMDGDARGGAALSMRMVTGKTIRMVGMGEKIDALEPFYPDRVAGRILGMGDVVSLVERAVETVQEEDAQKIAAKFQKGEFDFNDLLSQLRQMKRMGGMNELAKMLPGLSKFSDQIAGANLDDKVLKRQEAMILSMTPQERSRPAILNASRRRRIAAGSGTTVQDLNKLVKQYEQMATMMKRMKKMGMSGMMNMMKGLMGGKDAALLDAMQAGGGGDHFNAQDLQTMMQNMPASAQNPFAGSGSLPSGFPGLMGGAPRSPMGGLLGGLAGRLKK